MQNSTMTKEHLMNTLALGLIGNSRTSALSDKNASIVWWCYPYFDSDPLCSKLMSPKTKEGETGFIDVLCDNVRQISQQYERNTAILSTRFEDAIGNSFEVLDFAPRFQMHGRLFAPAMLVRIIRRLEGRPRITLRIRPTVNYGEDLSVPLPGTNHISYTGTSQTMRVTTDAPVSTIIAEQAFYLNRTITLLMGPDQTVDGAPREVGRSFLEHTQHYWHAWVRNLAIPFEWQEATIRAAITLRMNTFDDTGAIIAAMTTSIPEAPDSGRNWDYRYCWLRDAYFVVSALNTLGATGTMLRYLDYILNIIADTRGSPLQPVYGIHRDAVLDEREIPTLSGYRKMGPVRVGNLAYLQIQNDVFGAAILASTHSFFDSRIEHPAGPHIYSDLERLGELAIRNYDVPDAGIWELRGSKRIHTFSSVMCWAACDRLAEIGKRLGLSERADYWRDNARQMHDEICRQAWNPALNSFVSTFGGDRLDASLLLMGELRFLEPGDPRFAGTIAAVEKHLRRGNYLLRYDEQDDFGMPETAFIVCTFWWILALTYIGETARARELFENILSKRNHLGLLSEDVDPATGELWGNFPQTYSMVGIVQCAMRLSTPWHDAF
jgi:GH15 family glucan-1,4-alpha-glucosidase